MGSVSIVLPFILFIGKQAIPLVQFLPPSVIFALRTLYINLTYPRVQYTRVAFKTLVYLSYLREKFYLVVSSDEVQPSKES